MSIEIREGKTITTFNMTSLKHVFHIRYIGSIEVFDTRKGC